MTRDYIIQQHTSGRNLHIDYARELNKQQLDAVTAPNGPMLVIAGAGSGKTRTLTYRVAWLIEHGVNSENILLLTFTNKAAREMLERVQAVLPADMSRLWGGTFHSVGNRILRRHAELLGYEPGFSILDRDDSKSLINSIIDESKVTAKKKDFPKAGVLLEMFSLSVNTEKPLARIVKEQYPYFEGFKSVLVTFHDVYQERKKKANAMDFDDLLAHWLRLLRDYPEICESYGRQFQHILVDEYQDTNKIQADIVDRLAAVHRNVMVVGDDSQSIYSWRGANFQNIISFPDRFEGCRIFKIESNYRSTPQILQMANSVIAANRQQFPKSLSAVRKSGPRPVLASCVSGGEEASFVAQRVMELHSNGFALDEIAVLYRAHFHSMELQMELTRRNIPFYVASGLRFFEQAHVKDVASFLRFASNPSDEVSFRRVAKLLPGIGDRTAEKLWQKISSQEVFPDALQCKEVVGAVPSKALPHWRQMAYTVSQLLLPPAKDNPYRQIAFVIEGMYEDYLKTAYPDFRNRLDDLQQLADFGARFDNTSEFLTQLALMTGVEEERPTPGGKGEAMLWLSTVHQAKGLEWRAVFVIGLAEEMFPSPRAIETEGGEEEERRLFYVAVTRAEDELYLTHPVFRGRDGSTQQPSRFLADVPEELIDRWRLSQRFTRWDD